MKFAVHFPLAFEISVEIFAGVATTSALKFITCENAIDVELGS